MVLDLSRLSAEQRQVVLAGDGPLLVLAGPGSGKTTVLAARIAYLVTVRRVGPASVLALAFEDLLRGRSAVDYPAMLALPLRLLREHEPVLRLYQGAYRAVLCDEGQDVCAAQYALLRLLAERHQNLVLVGDPLQAIYGFRGADARCMRAFRRDFPEARVLALSQNFRSTGRIVDLANALGASLDRRRVLWTSNPPGRM